MASRLEQLSRRMPVTNQRLASQQKAARDLQLQQAVSQAPQGAGLRTAQAVGGQMAQVAGQQQAQRDLQQRQGAQQVAGLVQQQRGAQAAEQLGRQQLATQREQVSTAERLGRLNMNLKNQLVDQQMQFQRDQSGRQYLNDRQLIDYAKSQAQSQEELANYRQATEQATKRKLQMLEAANKKIAQEIEQASRGRQSEEKQKYKEELLRRKKFIADKIESDRREAAAKAQMWGMAGGIIGGVVGAYAGGPQGAMAGYSAGQGVGTMGASAT